MTVSELMDELAEAPQGVPVTLEGAAGLDVVWVMDRGRVAEVRIEREVG